MKTNIIYFFIHFLKYVTQKNILFLINYLLICININIINFIENI